MQCLESRENKKADSSVCLFCTLSARVRAFQNEGEEVKG